LLIAINTDSPESPAGFRLHHGSCGPCGRPSCTCGTVSRCSLWFRVRACPGARP